MMIEGRSIQKAGILILFMACAAYVSLRVQGETGILPYAIVGFFGCFGALLENDKGSKWLLTFTAR